MGEFICFAGISMFLISLLGTCPSMAAIHWSGRRLQRQECGCVFICIYVYIFKSKSRQSTNGENERRMFQDNANKQRDREAKGETRND